MVRNENGNKKETIFCLIFLEFGDKEFAIEDICKCGYFRSMSYIASVFNEMIKKKLIIKKGYRESQKIDRAIRTYVLDKEVLLEYMKQKSSFFLSFLLMRDWTKKQKFGIMEPEIFDSKEVKDRMEKYKNKGVIGDI